MVALMIILCAVSLTASIFLIARFGIKKKENDEFVSADLKEEAGSQEK